MAGCAVVWSLWKERTILGTKETGIMKIFLDDVRSPPDASWVVVRTYDEFIDLWERCMGDVTHIAFDHDLGDEAPYKTGYGCACAVEESVYAGEIDHLPIMTAHSDNPFGNQRILQAITSCYNYMESL